MDGGGESHFAGELLRRTAKRGKHPFIQLHRYFHHRGSSKCILIRRRLIREGFAAMKSATSSQVFEEFIRSPSVPDSPSQSSHELSRQKTAPGPSPAYG